MNFYLSSFFSGKTITEDGIRLFLQSTDAKRICFSRIHKHALWKTNEGKNMFTIPFDDSIGRLMNDRCGVSLSKAKSGKYYAVLSSSDYDKVKTFIDEYSDIVFLRDLLDVSVALSMNYEDDQSSRTPIGQLEKEAKYDNNNEAAEKISVLVDDFIANNPCYKNADYICAVPPSNKGEENLPLKILKKLKNFPGTIITNELEWSTKSESLKNADGKDKLDILKESGFKIQKPEAFKNKNIVLLDDLYMSGVTMQYVAMRLKEAGAKKVYGLCLVKSFSNK